MPKVAGTPAQAQSKRKAEAQTVAVVTGGRSGGAAAATRKKKKRTQSETNNGRNLLFSPDNNDGAAAAALLALGGKDAGQETENQKDGKTSDEELTPDDELEDEEKKECEDLEHSEEDEGDEEEEDELTPEDEQEYQQRKEYENLAAGFFKCPAGQRSISIGRSKSGKSNRIKEKENEAKAKARKEAANKKAKAKKGRGGKEIGLSEDWETVHARTRTALVRKLRGLYVIKIADGLYKLGFIYLEGDLSTSNLGTRIKNVTQGIDGGVDVRFIDTGDLNQDAVKRIELLAKFVCFVKTTTTEDGTELSHYSGQGELYKMDKSFVDELLIKLLDYAKSGLFHLDVGNGVPDVITGESVGTKKHKKWFHFAYKTGYTAHRNLQCNWTGGDKEGEGEEYWQEWIDFARSPDCTCPCITKSNAATKKKKKKKRTQK